MAYDGHEAYGSFVLANAAPTTVAPADRTDYDPTAYTAQPGAAARANGYPRADGQAFGAGASFGK